MVIDYKDFFPAVVKTGFSSDKPEELPATVRRANAWIVETRVRVLNVETIVLPNSDTADDSSRMCIPVSAEITGYWYQVIRVWYERSA